MKVLWGLDGGGAVGEGRRRIEDGRMHCSEYIICMHEIVKE